MSPTATATAQPTPADLSARPLIWFAPLPPLPTGQGRPFTGSDDFMDLFAPGADWDRASRRIGVFKLYGEWVAHAPPDQLRAAVEGIRARGQVLAIEMGPLDAPPGCGSGVESFAGVDEGRLLSQRVRQAGGTIQVIALDEPYYFAHRYDGPSACHWAVDRVADGVAQFVRAMRGEWPAVIVGDIEPTPAPIEAHDLSDWLGAYQAGVGEPLAFLHLDMDWSRFGWPDLALDIEHAARDKGVPLGMIYNGGAATSDEAWARIAGRRVLDHLADGARPDHVVFQSWMDKPDRVLPESDPTTFTALVNRYVDEPGSLAGARDTANLALGRPIRASGTLRDAPASQAADGDPDTIWNAGAGPPAWIEIDLGRARAIATIRLTVGQDPSGRTRHVITCRRAGGDATRLGALSGTTRDLDVLEVRPAADARCRFIRIETRASPSWVAWREIEIIAP